MAMEISGGQDQGGNSLSTDAGNASGNTLASPITHLYAEERYRDLQAREAVFTTFNTDLGFFERTVLGVTQATGARIILSQGRPAPSLGDDERSAVG